MLKSLPGLLISISRPCGKTIAPVNPPDFTVALVLCPRLMRMLKMFNEPELSYLKSQRLARIATVSSALQPDVAPVGFEFDGEHFFVGGIHQLRTNKYKNVASGNYKVALVIDDVESDDPWTPRGIKIHGRARIVDRPGQYGPYLEVTPEKTWSWGIESPVFEDGKVVMKKGTSAAKKSSP